MSHRADTWTRIALLLVALSAISGSFGAAANDALERPQKFATLTGLAIVVLAAGFIGLDVVQGYTKRRPLRLRWGKPATNLEPAAAGPARRLPDNWHVESGLRLPTVIAGFAASLAATLVLGAIGYAWAGNTSQYGAGLLIYLALAIAAWLSGRFLVRLVFRRRVVELSADGATAGVGAGYWPALKIPRSSVVGIETSPERQLLAFVTTERRYEISTAMLDNPDLEEEIAGLWPEVTWHDMSPDAIPTTLGRV